MASDDKINPTPAFETLTPVSTINAPEKVALSSTTTACDPMADRSPRTSKESYKGSNPFETDIEAMEIVDTQQPCVSRSPLSKDKHNPNCTVWPGKDHWKQKAKAAKKKRSCALLAGMSKRNRVISKILLVLLVVGIAVGVGFGVSKPLGAPIWGNHDNH
ncbi:uncharacterized protein J7T54_004217 [Emericellopsis cladophorae]|uniref:Uncharacterized protein n=1 Tax=Emericellopsis cladophorae TaxID=2686198 RepID=A0A9P9XYL3_9HYPO|nr:uncharacterized protein J7T54_004217 [Emericellopsis cladophorae]KAI6780085.1 hypothetical protein J7T54_004217 [Emericellopsis cladophorae]